MEPALLSTKYRRYLCSVESLRWSDNCNSRSRILYSVRSNNPGCLSYWVCVINNPTIIHRRKKAWINFVLTHAMDVVSMGSIPCDYKPFTPRLLSAMSRYFGGIPSMSSNSSQALTYIGIYSGSNLAGSTFSTMSSYSKPSTYYGSLGEPLAGEELSNSREVRSLKAFCSAPIEVRG